ncbi:glycerophosphoryl diester phosphodiesterase membrane domain-containing protein [Microbacterium sp.]|uniref:glycerophosphoryl diester phosphodiesterase membrane domain-containing protein n=1 Tax=Microbacterium sp. TaxID=51671 RepID=UPI003F6E5F2B
MTAYPAWTPASRPGIVPLHPLSFGTILGRSFVALRQNPKVLLGFALVVQTLTYIVLLGAIGAITWATYARLSTLRPGTEDFETVTVGSVAILIIASFVLGLAAQAMSVIVQGVVVVEVTHAVVAEKLTLRAIWRQVKPVVWRLIGYSLLLALALVGALVIVGGALFALGTVALPVAIVLGILAFLGAIVVVWWLTIKLLLAPSAILIERATIAQAVTRSWSLTRGRFWPALGIIVVIVVIFSALGQVVSLPFSFLSAGLGTIIAPTGDPDSSGVVAVVVGLLLVYAVLFVIQSVALVVQATATALIYVDCRMRHEGLDLDLLAYVERRDAGAADLPDPYVQHVGRVLAPRIPVAAGYPSGFPVGVPPAYGPPAATPAPAQTPAPAPPWPVSPPTPSPASPTTWTAPGAPPPPADRESPSA